MSILLKGGGINEQKQHLLNFERAQLRILGFRVWVLGFRVYKVSPDRFLKKFCYHHVEEGLLHLLVTFPRKDFERGRSYGPMNINESKNNIALDERAHRGDSNAPLVLGVTHQNQCKMLNSL